MSTAYWSEPHGQPSSAVTATGLPPAVSEHDLAVALRGVAVCYQLPSERITSLKEYAVRRLRGRRVEMREFWALRGINLSVRRGAAVALIGANGAGKSTLLKLIARVMRPSQGRVVVRGLVAPLIELGAGMNPELTGRENIFINGAMLGFTRRQMQSKLDRIVAFSGLHEFIDSPLRTYSNGMMARLGFSVATEVDPDILIVDEAIAVGDEAFQAKCMDRMREFRSRGVTIFYVTHGVGTVHELCPRTVWLEGGRIKYAGQTEQIVEMYRHTEEHDALGETQRVQVLQRPSPSGVLARLSGRQRAIS